MNSVLHLSSSKSRVRQDLMSIDPTFARPVIGVSHHVHGSSSAGPIIGTTTALVTKPRGGSARQSIRSKLRENYGGRRVPLTLKLDPRGNFHRRGMFSGRRTFPTT